MVFLVRLGNVDRVNIERPVLAEARDPLQTEKLRAYGADGDGVGPHENPLVGPDEALVKKAGPPSVELRRQGNKDVESRLSLYDREGPDAAEVRAGIGMIVGRLAHKLYVVFDQC